MPASSLDDAVVVSRADFKTNRESATFAAGAGAGAGGGAVDDDSVDEETLQARVDRLAARVGSSAESSVSEDDAGALAIGAARDNLAGSAGAVAPRAASLHVALEQALQTQDNSQLEYCLAINDKLVLERTVARLSAHRVLPFLMK